MYERLKAAYPLVRQEPGRKPDRKETPPCRRRTPAVPVPSMPTRETLEEFVRAKIQGTMQAMLKEELTAFLGRGKPSAAPAREAAPARAVVREHHATPTAGAYRNSFPAVRIERAEPESRFGCGHDLLHVEVSPERSDRGPRSRRPARARTGFRAVHERGSPPRELVGRRRLGPSRAPRPVPDRGADPGLAWCRPLRPDPLSTGCRLGQVEAARYRAGPRPPTGAPP